MPTKSSRKGISKKRAPKWNRQMAQLIALSQLTRNSTSDFIEEAFDQFLEVTAWTYLSHCSVSIGEWKKRAASISESDIEVWTPLWAILQDGYDQAIDGESAPECGDPGSQHAWLEAIAEDAGVGRFYTIRAGLYRFCDEHAADFIADPHNLKYRTPTKEEHEVLMEVKAERDDESGPPRWLPEDDPLFRQKMRKRIDDAISDLDAGIQ